MKRKLNSTWEPLPNNGARLIVYCDPLDPEKKITHDFDSMDQLLKHIDKATEAEGLDVI